MSKYERNGLHLLEKKDAQLIRMQDSGHLTTKNKKMVAIFVVLSWDTMLISITCYTGYS